MPPPVKNGTPERYWREVQALSRLRIALLRDEALEDGIRSEAVLVVETLSEKLVSLAKGAAA
jgi:hypothetical protein